MTACGVIRVTSDRREFQLSSVGERFRISVGSWSCPSAVWRLEPDKTSCE